VIILTFDTHYIPNIIFTESFIEKVSLVGIIVIR